VERLPDLEVVKVADCPSHADSLLGYVHLLLQNPVAARLVGLGVPAEVDGLGVGIQAQVLVDLFGYEGNVGRRCLHEPDEHSIQSLVRLFLVAVVFAAPEAAAAAAYVPVVELVDKLDYWLYSAF